MLTCSHCRTESPVGSLFCNQCGALLDLSCSGCEATNPPGSHFCNQCGLPLDSAAPGRQAVDSAAPGPAMSPILGVEERRPVTVLFADIVGFTTLSERMDPEEVRDVTAACFGRLVEEIARRGGTVDKFIGDAVMALFGAPLAHEDDPVRAVDTALAMQATLGEINGELERDHGLRLELRIGVNTGEVVAGVRQVGGLHDFTVIGDTVNTASRLQTAAAPGTVIVGETTARLAHHAFEFEPLPPLALRGKANPVAAFCAVGPLDHATVADAERVSLIGREAELTTLAERIERVAGGQGQVVVITGEPGAGKTRLMAELRRMVQADPRVRWGEAHAAPYGRGQSFRMYAATLRELFGTRGLAPEEAVERLRKRLAELDVHEALPFVCHLLDVPLDEAARVPFMGLSRDEVQRRARRAMRQLWMALGNEKPFVLAVDDLQWADPAVVEFLEGALPYAARVPVMMCFLFRPDRDAPCWPLKEQAARELAERYTEIDLGPLGEAESRELLRQLLGGAELGERAEARLLARVEGNPLYAQEVVRTFLERGALVRRDGRWELDASAAGRVPETLQATILARIDRLPEDARHVVQIGAVLGRTFSHQLLARVAGDGAALQRGLREAIRAGLLHEREPSPAPGYTFTQSLVQEVAERTLLVRRRRELHRAAVEGIEALYAGQLAAHASGLASHALGAEDWAVATKYAQVAAERAMSSYANREGLNFYNLGLQAAAHLGTAASSEAVTRLLAGKAEALSRLGRFEECAAALVEALACAARPDFVGDDVGDQDRYLARLALELCRAYVAQLRTDDVERTLEIAFANLREAQAELATAWSVRSWALLQREDLGGAAAAARTALEIALEHGGFDERAEAYGALTRPALAGEIGPSIRTYAEEAVRLAREHQHDGHLLEALLGLEVLRLVCLQPPSEEGLTNALDAVELAHKMDSLPAERAARVILGATYLMQGDWDDAERELQAARGVDGSMPIAEAMRELLVSSLWTARGRLEEAHEMIRAGLAKGTFPHAGVWFNVELAYNRLLAGEPEIARAALADAEREHARIGCLSCEAAVCGWGGEILAALGDPHALDLAERAEAAGDGAFPIARMLSHRARAVMALHAADWVTAITHLQQALDLHALIRQPQEHARTLHQLARARLGRRAPGDLEAARAELDEALDTFARIDAVPERTLVEQLLAELASAEAVAS